MTVSVLAGGVFAGRRVVETLGTEFHLRDDSGAREGRREIRQESKTLDELRAEQRAELRN